MAVGQYLVYREVLALTNPNTALYLAIPTHIYVGRIGETYREVLQHNHVKIIVVDIKREVIDQWIEQ